MEEAAKRYARRILLIHLLVFFVLMTFVIFTARDVYDRTRGELLEQTTTRQALLVNQTAKGIESLYDSVFDDMSMLNRVEASHIAELQLPAGARRSTLIGTLVWKQVEDRASSVFVYEKATGGTTEIGAAPGALPVSTVVQRTRNWIETVDAFAVSKFQRFDDRGVNLVCVPSPDRSRVLVATIDVKDIDERFLQEVNKQASMGITLVDENLSMMATSNKALVGVERPEHPRPGRPGDGEGDHRQGRAGDDDARQVGDA
jgi:hypothetical protein